MRSPDDSRYEYVSYDELEHLIWNFRGLIDQKLADKFFLKGDTSFLPMNLIEAFRGLRND